MADETKDTQLYVRVAGVPFKVTQEQAAALSGSTNQFQFLDQARAQEGSQALADMANARQTYGTGGALAMGAASGLTLGMGPALASRLGFINPDTLGAISETGAFTAGDVLGTVAPALMTGGESLAMRATPAGLMGSLGGVSERFAASFLPKTGFIGEQALRMAARGATEGALINIGHTIGDNLVQNKPLAAEALLASGANGAMFGGLLGAGFGVVGGVGKALYEKVPGAVGRTAGNKGLGIVARELGMSAEQVAEAEAGGTLAETLKAYRQVLTDEGSGVTYGSGASAMREASSRQNRLYELARKRVVQEAAEQAPLAVPTVERVTGRLETESVQPKLGTLAEREAKAFHQNLVSELQPIELKPPPKPKKANANDWAYKVDGKWKVGSMEEAFSAFREERAKWNKIQGGGPVNTWEGWVKTRDRLDERLRSGFYKGLDEQMAKDALRVIDNEIENSLTGIKTVNPDVGKGLWERYAAASNGMKMARELEQMTGKKAAQDLLKHETTFTPRDLAVFGGMSAIGHPGTAAAWMAAKGLGRRINSFLGPGMAEMAYQASIGSRAAQAEQRATFKIRDSVRKFFSNASKTARKGSSVAKAEKDNAPKSKFDRKAYEEAVSRAEEMISASHQAKVQELINGMAASGYQELAKQLWLTNQRAVQYIQFNMPPRRAVNQGMGALRKTPIIHGLDMKEFQFLRKWNGSTSPLSLLDKIQDGSMSRDEVRAMKYIYPELHSQIAYEAAQQISQMKAEGKHLPMDKIVSLGIMLDSPVDTMLDSSRVNAIQASFVPPQPPQQAPPPEQQFSTKDLQTPIDALG